MSLSFDALPRNIQLSLCLPFADITQVPAAGDLTHDFAKPMNPTTLARENWHTFTLAGGTIAWTNLVTGQPYIDLTRATPDYLSCPNASTQDLGFTSEEFSAGIWINADLMAAATEYFLFSRSNNTDDGWDFKFVEDVLTFTTYQAGPASQVSTSLTGKIVVGTWALVGFSRGGTGLGDTKIFVNGVDVTAIGAAHTDPDASAEIMYIGADNTPGNGFDGKMDKPIIVAEKALTADEWYSIYLADRKRFGLA